VDAFEELVEVNGFNPNKVRHETRFAFAGLSARRDAFKGMWNFTALTLDMALHASVCRRLANP